MESGTCNVCSAPCSSCMHRNASFTGSKSDESSDENSHGVVASQCSSRVNALGSSHNTASEASNLDNSNHESSHNLLSDHQARNIPGQGKFKEKAGAENNVQDKKSSLTESSTHSDESGMIGKSGENIPSNKAEEPNASAMSESESESAGSELMELDVSNAVSSHIRKNYRTHLLHLAGLLLLYLLTVTKILSEKVLFVVEQVKVCDICGDAGREDLLAICSRCSDGAEHT